MDKRAVFRLALIAIALLVTTSSIGAQCAMCRLSLTTSAEGLRLAGALREGILILIAAPFSVFAVISAIAWRISRQLRAHENDEAR